MKVRSESAQTDVDARHATEGPADVLDGTSRSPTERNTAGMPRSDAAAEASGIMRAKAPIPRILCPIHPQETGKQVLEHAAMIVKMSFS
jgi:hypothetical protein